MTLHLKLLNLACRLSLAETQAASIAREIDALTADSTPPHVSLAYELRSVLLEIGAVVSDLEAEAQERDTVRPPRRAPLLELIQGGIQ